MSELSDMRVLVVDDSEANIDIIVDTLGRKYRVNVAMNGESALEMVGRNPPDLILLDIIMPEMDGYEVCRQLKQDQDTQDIPVIFLTAKTGAQDIVQGFAVGAADYISKPINTEEVLARVGNHLENRRLHSQLAEENARFRTLAEASFEGIFIHQSGRIIDVNSEAARLLTLDRQLLLGQSLLELVPEQCHGAVLKEEAGPWEGEITDHLGKPVDVEIQTRSMDFGAQPVSVTAIRDLSAQKTVEREKLALKNENRVLKSGLKERYKFGEIIGRSPAMQTVYEQLTQAAATEFHVVIIGESGTGKELVARTIYGLSSRKDGAFVAVNCGGIAESLFEREFFGHRKGSFTGADRDQPGFFDEAHGGTLFLDELGELQPSVQAKLLRVLENGEYVPIGATRAKNADARIISATNKDLAAMVGQGTFREDLFYRIHVIDIHLPPLRERKEDIPLLVDFFLASFPTAGGKPRLTGKMMDTLTYYEWPGNVRELQNTMQRFLATGQISLPGSGSMSADEDEEALAENGGLAGALERVERRLIMQSLSKTQWNRGQAAELLDISRWTLQRKMQKYEIEKETAES